MSTPSPVASGQLQGAGRGRAGQRQPGGAGAGAAAGRGGWVRTQAAAPGQPGLAPDADLPHAQVLIRQPPAGASTKILVHGCRRACDGGARGEASGPAASAARSWQPPSRSPPDDNRLLLYIHGRPLLLRLPPRLPPTPSGGCLTVGVPAPPPHTPPGASPSCSRCSGSAADRGLSHGGLGSAGKREGAGFGRGGRAASLAPTNDALAPRHDAALLTSWGGRELGVEQTWHTVGAPWRSGQSINAQPTAAVWEAAPLPSA